MGFKPHKMWTTYEWDGDRIPEFHEEYGPELCDAQITVSEGHPYWNVIKHSQGKIKPDVGGDFETTRWSTILDRTVYDSAYVDWYGRVWSAHGNMIPSIGAGYGTAFEGWGYIDKNTDPGTLPRKFPALSSSDNELIVAGASAIAKTRPDLSPVNVVQFLVELRRDGIPFASKLSKDVFDKALKRQSRHDATLALRSPRAAADAFLENAFGLQPIISDLKAFRDINTKGLSTLDNLIANHGKTIRRRYDFPITNETTIAWHGGAAQFGFDTQFAWSYEGFFEGDLGDFRRPMYNDYFDVQTSKKAWFKGAYSIYMPPDNEPISRLRAAADKLRWDYGVELNLSTLYDLTPWSWLIDWQFNLGDLIRNVDKWSNDAVVLQYGYVMEETKSKYVVSPRKVVFNGNTAPSRHVPSMGVLAHKKRRIRATPYGFGLVYGDLSDYQKAILAALGITRF
jgi:hypothetical protein